MRNIDTMLRRLLGEQITIRAVLSDNLPAVMADASQLEQVLMNLSLNARDAMPQGGELTIRTGNVDAAGSGTGSGASGSVLLSITDTGTGMSPEVRARIFEPFFTTKEPGRGTGLGLAAVHGIVTQLGGSIDVESTVGQGTTFRLYLPATHAAVDVPVSAPAEPFPVGSETILLVEDERGVRSFITIALQRFGYRVIAAESAEAACVFVDDVDQRIDLVLTDMVLPHMGGKGLAEHVQRVRPLVRVLFMSGYTEQMSTAAGFLAPGVQLLEKPFTVQALLTKTRDMLGPPIPR